MIARWEIRFSKPDSFNCCDDNFLGDPHIELQKKPNRPSKKNILQKSYTDNGPNTQNRQLSQKNLLQSAEKQNLFSLD